ncbi:hypothetical protein SCLCIDRAFT_1221540 [Scleroderma citrinum Foug A]|uniref:Uncharacterized protein n=1 Tax=Scleroderma citrinum Foug A TaxID=1036808 RepID=A0A0C3DEW7_9AGAM|nr:hypothetical protein SCLCIDRAFT_1221540 [Scleroderma citrinum Foug A]
MIGISASQKCPRHVVRLHRGVIIYGATAQTAKVKDKAFPGYLKTPCPRHSIKTH